MAIGTQAACSQPSRVAIGVDLGGSKIEAIALSADGRDCWRHRVPTPRGDYPGTLAAVAALVQRAERELGVTGCSVGVGTPGTPDATGRIKNANSQCLNGQPLADDLAVRLARPIRIANDANCLALSEATDGAAAGAEVVFAAILGTGVGGGLVVHGRLLTGPHGLAGEWGHNPLPWAARGEHDAPICYCGKRGCIESWLSGPALARDHAARAAGAGACSTATSAVTPAMTSAMPSAADRAAPSAATSSTAAMAAGSAEAIVERAAAGDAACEASLRRYEDRLARALAQVINLIDPHVIVLGGGLSNVQRLYCNVPALWRRHVFGADREAVRTRLSRSLHGDSSGVRGAAWLWRDGVTAHLRS